MLAWSKKEGREGYRKRVEKERGIENEMESEKKERNTHNLGGKHKWTIHQRKGWVNAKIG